MSRPHRPLLLVLCAAASLLFAQKKTPAVPTKTPTELSMERQGLVDLRSVDPTIQVSLMYGRATTSQARFFIQNFARLTSFPPRPRR